MPADATGRRVSYDRVWGALLLLTCFIPAKQGGSHFVWSLLPGAGPGVVAWLLLGTAAGVAALVVGWSGWRTRWRHLLNFAFGVATLALPLAAPAIWRAYPHANPSSLPLREMSSIGWVVVAALAAIYAGSGIRIVRPSHIAGQAVGALGALLLAIFAFLPLEGHDASYAWARIRELIDREASWRDVLPAALVAAGAIAATVNLIRSRAEVFMAGAARVLLVSGLLAGVVVPFLDSGYDVANLPPVWGAIRLLAPLLLALDGCVAFLAISMTRGGE